jgi:hypothetical protein
MTPQTRPRACAKACLIAVISAGTLAGATVVRADQDEPFHKFLDAPAKPAAKTDALAERSVVAGRLRHGRSNLGADLSEPEPPKSLSGGSGINWNANAGCLNAELRDVLAEVAAGYSAVTVNSTCRNSGHNASVGGAAHSYHLSGNAVDFRVHGNVAAVTKFLNSRVGGIKPSGDGLFHIDTGPRRPMN